MKQKQPANGSVIVGYVNCHHSTWHPSRLAPQKPPHRQGLQRTLEGSPRHLASDQRIPKWNYLDDEFVEEFDITEVHGFKHFNNCFKVSVPWNTSKLPTTSGRFPSWISFRNAETKLIKPVDYAAIRFMPNSLSIVTPRFGRLPRNPKNSALRLSTNVVNKPSHSIEAEATTVI